MLLFHAFYGYVDTCRLPILMDFTVKQKHDTFFLCLIIRAFDKIHKN